MPMLAESVTPTENITQRIPRRPRVIALIRISDLEGGSDDKHGIPRQRTQIRNGAKHHEIDIIREVVVIDVSGKHVMEDEQFQGIFADLRSGAADGVIVAEQSRLVRPGRWSDFGILDIFKDHKRIIWTPSARIDPNTREGWYILTTGGMISGDELTTLYQRLVGAKQELRDEGKHAGGDHMLPRYVRYVRERDPKNHRRILSSHFEYGPQSEVDKILKAIVFVEGQMSWQEAARAVGMTGIGLRRALQNPLLIGIRRYGWKSTGEEYYPEGRNGEKRKKRRKMVRMEKPQDVIIPELAGEKALITVERYDRLQEIVAVKRAAWMKSKLKNEGRARHLAPGITYCECGLKMYPRYGSRQSETDYYYCKSRHKGGCGCGMPGISRIDLDFTIREMLIPQLRKAEFLLEALAIHEQSSVSAQRDNEQTRRDAELADLKTQRSKLVDGWMKGRVSDEDYDAKREPINQQIRILELSAKTPVADDFNPAAYVEGVSKYFAIFASLPFAEQRDMLRRAVKEIMIQAGAIVMVTLNGGWLRSCVNSQLQRTLQQQIDTTSHVVLRFPQPIVIKSIVAAAKLARKETKQAAAAIRRATPEFKEAQRVKKRKGVMKPEAYAKMIATTATSQRNRRDKVRESDPEAYAALKAQGAARQKARYERRRANPEAYEAYLAKKAADKRAKRAALRKVA